MQDLDLKNKTLDLKDKTFLDAANINYENYDITNEKVLLYNLIVSGLNQLHNAKLSSIDNSYKLVSFKITEQIEKDYRKAVKSIDNSANDRDAIYVYDNLKNIAYLTDVGKNSFTRVLNDSRQINTSGHYMKKYTLQSMIESYTELTDVEKQEIEDARKINKRNLDRRDILYKLLIKIQRAIHYIYPIKREDDGTLTRLGNFEMLPPVSALLTLTYNTLKKINPLDAYEK